MLQASECPRCSLWERRARKPANHGVRCGALVSGPHMHRLAIHGSFVSPCRCATGATWPCCWHGRGGLGCVITRLFWPLQAVFNVGLWAAVKDANVLDGYAAAVLRSVLHSWLSERPVVCEALPSAPVAAHMHTPVQQQTSAESLTQLDQMVTGLPRINPRTLTRAAAGVFLRLWRIFVDGNMLSRTYSQTAQRSWTYWHGKGQLWSSCQKSWLGTQSPRSMRLCCKKWPTGQQNLMRGAKRSCKRAASESPVHHRCQQVSGGTPLVVLSRRAIGGGL